MNSSLSISNSIRRISLLILAVAVSFALAACVKDTTTTTTTTSVATTSTSSQTTIELGENTKVQLYDGPDIMTSSQKAIISVEGYDVFAYDTLVNYGRTFTFTETDTTVPIAIFDFEGQVSVTIEIVGETVTSAKVTPLSYGIEPVITDGNKITFTLSYPTSYTVEYNDDYHNAVHLFTNVIEDENYDPNNLPDDVLYIGPGVYKADNIPVSSNQTIYIAGGAVVYGKIRTENMDNVTIKGRGIISGSIYPRSTASEYTIPIELRHSTNITIDGITFLNPAGWCMAVYFSEDITIQNVHIITARANGDGISVQSSKNVLVRNSFVRTWDDALVVKNYNLGTTENVTFDNIIIWTDLAQSMEVGYETYGATMTNITFKNITVLHNFHKPVMSIHNSDQAAISSVTFQNITVEDAQMIGDNATDPSDDYLIEIFIRYHQVWSSSGGERGSIDNVLIENVNVLNMKDGIVSLVHGYDDTHDTDGVTIHNLTLEGVNVTDASQVSLTTNDYVRNLNIYSDATATGAEIYHPYELNLPDTDTPEVSVQANISQAGYIVPEFARADAISSYMGMMVEGTFTAFSSKGIDIATYDDGSGSRDQLVGSSELSIDGNPESIWESLPFVEDTTIYTSLTINFDENKSIGTIRLYGDIASDLYRVQYISVYGIKSTSTTNAFTKILSTNGYEFSPASGNVVDLKIRSGEFKAIQFRFYYVDEPQASKTAFLGEVEFYPASLSFSKSVVASENEDVYTANYIVDGNPLTYYESKRNTWPAFVTIDLLANYDVRYISMYLPAKWEDRTQEIEILVSNDGVSFSTLIAKTAYEFKTINSNVVEIVLDQAVNTRYMKFVFYSNSSGYGGQVSEINIFS